MFGIITKKEKIQSLEAQVRGLVEENQKLQVERNEQRLRAESYRKACDMIFKSHQDGLPAESLSEVDCDSNDDLPFKRKEKESEIITDVDFEDDDYPF